jgi:hypothetical protein
MDGFGSVNEDVLDGGMAVITGPLMGECADRRR